MNDSKTRHGHCLCGDIEYSVSGDLAFVANCHCSICRRSHGANMATQAVLFQPKLEWIRGEESLTHYQATEGYTRSFCKRCGSRLINYPDNMVFVSLSINSLDEVPEELVPTLHVYTGSKPRALNICDDLPQFEELPEQTANWREDS